MLSLRLNDGSGKMKLDGENLLPRRNVSDSSSHRFAGDVRAIEMPGLATMHTLFVRWVNIFINTIIESLRSINLSLLHISAIISLRYFLFREHNRIG